MLNHIYQSYNQKQKGYPTVTIVTIGQPIKTLSVILELFYKAFYKARTLRPTL